VVIVRQLLRGPDGARVIDTVAAHFDRESNVKVAKPDAAILELSSSSIPHEQLYDMVDQAVREAAGHDWPTYVDIEERAGA
jgi:hypothetical protein